MESAGGRAFLVGGGVRDHLMGREVKDWDVEVFGLSVDPLRTVLLRRGRVNAVGRAFGVLKWRVSELEGEIDVSIPRRDSKVGPGHRGIAVEGDPDMTLDEATRRRDLTINAILWDLSGDVLVDPRGGCADLDAGILRAVDPVTFLEDPLRALRVVQFVARLGFTPDDELLACCRRAELAELPAERVSGEWEKLLSRGRHFSRAFQAAADAEVLQRVFPEVCHLRPGALLEGIVDARDAASPAGRRLALMALGWLREATPAAVVATLDRLGLYTFGGYRVREQLLAAHSALGHPTDTDAAVRWLSTAAEPWLVCTVRQDAAGAARAAGLGLSHGPPPRLLQGRHLVSLGVPGGRAMGELLDEAWRAQLDGTLATEADALTWARERTGARSPSGS